MSLSSEQILSGLRAAGEATRLRILVLLAQGELTVKDLTRILGQSQPRISRHLKLLVDAGLLDRFSEGSWGYFRLSDTRGRKGAAGSLARMIVSAADLDDPTISRDLQRCASVKAERAAQAQSYFAEHAENWNDIRKLHVEDAKVEQAVLDALGTDNTFDLLVDIGTGTGRMLELCAYKVRRGIGVDINQAMLSYARANLEAADLNHCQVRQADLFNLPINDREADIAIFHQVLHFLDDPAGALREGARILKGDGKLIIVDFAPHEHEFLRNEHAHQRLGFSDEQIESWAQDANLTINSAQSFEADRRRTKALTVKLWTAEPSTRITKPTPSHTLPPTVGSALGGFDDV